MLGDAGGVRGLSRAGNDVLRRTPGIGAARAAQIIAAVELGRRSLTDAPERVQVTSPRMLAELLLPRHGNRAVEEFGTVLLDTKHRILRTVIVSVGTLDSSVVHPREVFREATTAGAAAVVLFHNHPSGDPRPSPDDVELTDRLVASGVVLGIEVLDHVILADTRYFSFKEHGFGQHG